jgi:hypothetical protein
MVADIHIGNNLYGALAYNQEKIDAGLGKILETNRIFVPSNGQFSIRDCVQDFERAMPPQVTTSRGIIHISLNPHPDDRLTDGQLSDIGREYMEKMGFGGQPYMIFKHEDIDRQHLHIVSTRVRGDGTLVSDKKNYERSRKITDELERKYGLHPKGQLQEGVWRLSPVDASQGNLKKQAANVIKPLAEIYRFRSLPEFRALLSLYNIGVEEVKGENGGKPYRGLVYSVLDAEGNRTGKPLKSSLFGKGYGIEALEQRMKKSGEQIKTGGQIDKTKATVLASLNASRTGSEFRADLGKKGIDLMLRYGNGGRLFGVTFIDHNSRTVLNGSALGREFSANALAERFSDLSEEDRREQQKPEHTPASADETVHAAIPDLLSVGDAAGSLFSVLTPEPENNRKEELLPFNRRKKKKRRYRRQL